MPHMMHEHQRADRDKFIQVLYKDLGDYRSCYQKVIIRETYMTEDGFCWNYKNVLRYGCSCWESTTSITINGESIDAGSKDFNYKSITIYNSVDWAEQDCIDNFKNCPLACWKDPDNHLKDPGEIANPPGVISRLNYERI
ncbi:hypothetical protein SLS59_002685 [Nothophoma quercina]|uniref:Peptidase M12A domain-containing protein n=1 Tax=Nothophoma quercina TaxID=749835 RepID=A0ABR3RRB9_9PLEO